MTLESANAVRPVRILALKSQPSSLDKLTQHLINKGCSVDVYLLDAIQTSSPIEGENWNVVIADDAIVKNSLTHLIPNAPLVVVTKKVEETFVYEAMRSGVREVLQKDDFACLDLVIERELSEARMRLEHRHVLEAIQESEARFRALAANIPGVVFQVKRNQNGTLSFLYVSEASQMLFGVSPDTLLGAADQFINMIIPEDRASFLASMTASSLRNSTLNWEGRIQLTGQELKWINVRCSPRPSGADESLWEGVMWNITQSRHNETELRVSRAQLAELSEHLQRVKEEERDRIARDIHDVLGGTLVGIKIATSLLNSKLNEQPKMQERLAKIETMLDDAIATTGRVARELRPGILKEFGLAAAVESYAEDFASRTGLSCKVLCADHDIETNEDTALALFRTYQEALTNVSKHANASEVRVRLMQEGDEILLEISDNGRGITSADLNKPRSFGLRSIRERLNILRGSFVVQAGAPCGTVVCLRAPLSTPKSEIQP